MSSTTFWVIIGVLLINLLLGVLIDISIIPVFLFLMLLGELTNRLDSPGNR